MAVRRETAEVVHTLNKALADEWLAFYQYWVSATLVGGPSAIAIAAAFKKVADEELEHAGELAERIVELGGAPLPNPDLWKGESTCGYLQPPIDPGQWQQALRNAIEGEACAIGVYQALAQKTKASDPATATVMGHILTEEVEHKRIFEGLLRA